MDCNLLAFALKLFTWSSLSPFLQTRLSLYRCRWFALSKLRHCVCCSAVFVRCALCTSCSFRTTFRLFLYCSRPLCPLKSPILQLHAHRRYNILCSLLAHSPNNWPLTPVFCNNWFPHDTTRWSQWFCRRLAFRTSEQPFSAIDVWPLM